MSESTERCLDGYVWRLRRVHPERRGQACTITPSDKNNWQVHVTFADGFRVLTTRQAVVSAASKVFRVEVR
jgi:hypothetical protein